MRRARDPSVDNDRLVSTHLEPAQTRQYTLAIAQGEDLEVLADSAEERGSVSLTREYARAASARYEEAAYLASTAAGGYPHLFTGSAADRFRVHSRANELLRLAAQTARRGRSLMRAAHLDRLAAGWDEYARTSYKYDSEDE